MRLAQYKFAEKMADQSERRIRLIFLSFDARHHRQRVRTTYQFTLYYLWCMHTFLAVSSSCSPLAHDRSAACRLLSHMAISSTGVSPLPSQLHLQPKKAASGANRHLHQIAFRSKSSSFRDSAVISTTVTHRVTLDSIPYSVRDLLTTCLLQDQHLFASCVLRLASCVFRLCVSTSLHLSILHLSISTSFLL